MTTVIFLLASTIVLVLVYLIGTGSISLLSPDKALVSILFGSYHQTYKPASTTGARLGLMATFWRDFKVLPWPFFRTVFLPLTDIVCRYHTSRVYTKDNIPIVVDLTIILRLGDDLRRFIETFNVFGRGKDLAYEEKISYEFDRNPMTGEVNWKTYVASCLAGVVLNITTDLVKESVRRAAQTMTMRQILGNNRDFELAILEDLASQSESAFRRSGILNAPIVVNVPNAKPDVTVPPGPAITQDGIDLNIHDVRPESDELFAGLSKPETGKLAGRGEGNRIKEITSKTKMDPAAYVQQETIRAIDNVTVWTVDQGLADSIKNFGQRFTGGGSGKKSGKGKPKKKGTT